MTLTRSGDDPARLLAALEAFADGTVARAVARDMAVAGQGLIHRGFEQSKAPSGERWAPLKSPRARGRKPLRKTGKLEGAALVYAVDASGFVFSAVDRLTRYGHFHMSGTRHMPARPFLPTTDTPTGWVIVLGEAADGALASALARALR